MKQDHPPPYMLDPPNQVFVKPPSSFGNGYDDDFNNPQNDPDVWERPSPKPASRAEGRQNRQQPWKQNAPEAKAAPVQRQKPYAPKPQSAVGSRG